MKTLESMNYREQNFDMCVNCKYSEFGYEGECDCKRVSDEEDEEGISFDTNVLKYGICDEYERRTK